MGATIRTHREMYCLPYAGFFTRVFLWLIHSQYNWSIHPRAYNNYPLDIIIPQVQFNRLHFICLHIKIEAVHFSIQKAYAEVCTSGPW